MSLWIRN